MESARPICYRTDSNLYVTEWPSSGRVLANTLSPAASRSLIPSAFANVQALDISPDHSALLVAPIRGGASNNEFWTLRYIPGRHISWVNWRAGMRVGRRTASNWYLRRVRHSTSQVPAAARSVKSLKAKARFSLLEFLPNGKRIRFTIGNTAQNTTAIWEVGSDGSQPHPVLEGWQHASSACCGHWTADGRYYIFQVTENGPMTVTTLWALSDSSVANGTGPGELTRGPMSFGSAAPAPITSGSGPLGFSPQVKPSSTTP